MTPWQSAVKHAAQLGLSASKLSLRHTDPDEISRSYAGVADAWEVAADALLEAGRRNDEAMISMHAARRLAQDSQTRRYLLVRGHIAERHFVPEINERSTLHQALDHVRGEWPVQTVRIESKNRRITLDDDEEETGGVLHRPALQIYSDLRSLRILQRSLHGGRHP